MRIVVAFLILIGLAGCNRIPDEASIVSPAYHKDPRTGICFASFRHTGYWRSFTRVECTPEVMALVGSGEGSPRYHIHSK